MSFQEDVGIVAIAIGGNQEAHEAFTRIIDELQHLRSLAGAVSRGPDLADIKQGVGRSNKT